MLTDYCGDNGDFGHTNVWGSPYLMFNAHCHLKKDHKGPHEGMKEIKIKPSSEKDGRKIKRDSVKVLPDKIVIQWENES